MARSARQAGQAKFTALAPERLDAHAALQAPPESAVWHPDLTLAYGALPGGEATFWGIPFRLVPSDSAGRWIWLGDGGVAATTVPLDAHAARIVIAHFAVPSRESVERGSPDQRPSGVIAHPGEHLANYVLEYASGSSHVQPVRRRFEVNDVVVAWGQLAFRARPHLATIAVDWRGPHADGEWGENQTGVRVPPYSLPPAYQERATITGNYWLYALDNPRPEDAIVSIRLEATGVGTLAVAAITLFHGQGDPLYHRAVETLRVEEGAPGPASGDVRGAMSRVALSGVSLDLGVVARVFAVPDAPALEPRGPYGSDESATPGWGSPRPVGNSRGIEPTGAKVIELAAADAATLTLGDEAVELADLRRDGVLELAAGTRIRMLAPADRWVNVTVRDESGRPTPCRVHFAAVDGRYLPPFGHRHEVNDRWFEDYGADLQLGGTAYAYVDGRSRIQLPVGRVFVEAVKGFEYEPLRQWLTVGAADEAIELTFERLVDMRREGWAAADTHVHFLSPDTARLEARAEGVDVVNLLASQWGDLFTNVGDFTGQPAGGDGHDVIVWVGAENRQHLLGHLASLGLTERLPEPLTASGPDESGIGDPAWISLAEWSDEARRQGALVIVPHFPEPLAEVMADVILGKVDGVEVRDFAWGVEGNAVREWYRLLDCGYRIPAVGGTDKMSAAMPLGGVRTYSEIGPELTFAGWQGSIRAGRTITTSGPILRLAVDGRPIGGEVPLGAAGGTVDVEASTISAQPVEALEVVHNGRVVARADAAAGTRELRVRERLPATPGWIAARCWGPGTLWHEWPMRVAAHTSPVYLGAPRIAPSPSDAFYLANVLDGGLAWLDTLATRANPARHERIRAVFLDARRLLGQPSPPKTLRRSGPAGRGVESPG